MKRKHVMREGPNVLKKQMEDPAADGRSHTDTTTLHIKAKVHRKLLQVLDLSEARRLSLDQLHTQCAERVNVLLTRRSSPSPRRRSSN